MAETRTPFYKFWAALSEQSRLNDWPPVTHGMAQRAWGAAIGRVVDEHLNVARRAA